MGRSFYDDLHDKYDPISTSKAGTRYERLSALVEKVLDHTAGVTHDLKLVGADTGVKHQIDVTITRDGQSRRVLVECKDFDISGEPVGLDIVRDFFGAVDDIKPDEAIVVTCNRFTQDAMRYAKGKGIKLAVLRRYTEQDDQGRIKSIELNLEIKIPINYRADIQFVDAKGVEAFYGKPVAAEDAKAGKLAMGTADRFTALYLHRPGHSPVQYVEALNELFNDPAYHNDVEESNGTLRKTIALPGAGLQRDSGPVIPIVGIIVTYSFSTHTHKMIIESAKIAELILEPIGEEDDFLIYDEDLKKFSIDPETGEVRPR